MNTSNTWIPKFLMVLGGAFAVIPCAAQTAALPDTIFMNETEVRFPETYPGEVFIVRKAIVGKGQSLRKAAQAGSYSDGRATASLSVRKASPFVDHDLRGRFTQQGGEYQKRLARIQQNQGLPLMSASVQAPGKPPKVVDRFEMPAGAKPALASNSPRIRTVQDLKAMEDAELAAVHRRYGALTPEFTKEVDAMKGNEEIDVTIELAVKNPGYINGKKASLKEKKDNARAWAQARPVMSGGEFLERYGLKRSPLSEGEADRLVVARVSKGDLKRLAHQDGIVSITPKPALELATLPGLGPINLQTLVNSAYNPASEMTNSYFQNVATMELGLTQDYLNCVGPELYPVNINRYVGTHSSNSAHSEEMYTLMALGSPYDNHHHFRSPGYTYAAIQDSIINYEIVSISTSIVAGRDQVTAADSRFVDRFAYVYPYPVISNAAGNNGHQYIPRNLTYNSLNVGNVQHYDNSHYRVDYQGFQGLLGPLTVPSSQSKNPPAVYGSTRDWELPSLVAPGFTPDPWWGFNTPCIYGNTLGTLLWMNGPGGTSLSAPIMAAMATNVIGAGHLYPSPSRPTAARAILLVTAQNVDSGYWKPAVQDSRDGAGTVSGANAVKFAIEASGVAPGSPAVVDGLGSDYFVRENYADQVYTPHIYQYQVPDEIPEGKHLRAVLTWTSSPGLNVAENRLSDLALWVESGVGWYMSDTWNSNVEMVDISNDHIEAGQVYNIVVAPMIFRAASDGPQEAYYSIAWTWVKNHAD